MKTSTLVSVAIAVTAYIAAIPVWAQQPQQSAFYIGGAVGQAKAKDACSGTAAAGIPIVCDDTDTSWKVFAGYEFNRYVAVEGGWADLGETTASATVLGTPVNAAVTAKGWEVLGVGSIPFNDQFSVYGKAGFFRWRVNGTVVAAGFGSESVEDSGTDFTYGVGLRYNFTKNIGARLEWQRYNNVGDNATTGQSDVNLVSLGIVIKF